MLQGPGCVWTARIKLSGQQKCDPSTVQLVGVCPVGGLESGCKLPQCPPYYNAGYLLHHGVLQGAQAGVYAIVNASPSGKDKPVINRHFPVLRPLVITPKQLMWNDCR